MRTVWRMTWAVSWVCVAAVITLSIGAAQAQATAQATATAVGWQDTPASHLKAALRTVVDAQERYRAERGTYASGVQALNLTVEPGIRIQILAARESGWQAKATHRARPGRSCVIFVGTVGSIEAPRTDGDREMAGEPGVPLCDHMR